MKRKTLVETQGSCMMKHYFMLIALALLLSSCATETKKIPVNQDVEFLALRDVDPSIVIDVPYATAHNFTGQVLYPNDELYLIKDAALRLKRVNGRLQKMGLRLKVWDAYRPLSIQKKLWEIVPDSRYVADPKKGSRHNRGCAVDVTIVDRNGNELPMPTGYDDFSEKAHLDYMDLPAEVIANRQLLIDVMTAEGFSAISTEWWHFDAPGWENYPVMDIIPNP
jgi:D-alanyl-D-alanine dipeptidase